MGEALDWWEASERRAALRANLLKRDGVSPDDVIMSPERLAEPRIDLHSVFPGWQSRSGRIGDQEHGDRPECSGRGRGVSQVGPAKVFTSEPSVIRAIKSGQVQAGDILVLMCRGPLGSGMEETYQVTSALKHLEFGKHVAVITDARFSGVSTGACIGHVSPEALAGGPIGKILDGDLIEIVVDRNSMEGTVNFVGENGRKLPASEAERVLAARTPRRDLAADPQLAGRYTAMGSVTGCQRGTMGGSVYDVDTILRVLEAGKAALAQQTSLQPV